ncbi:MAG: class I SAM-dependent methyltransferase [Planctomycetota bacterium]
MEPWFETAFGRDYLTVYAARSVEAAAADVAIVVDALGLEPGHRILDLACGAGRYSGPFVDGGFDVTGLDYSRDLLAAASAAVPRARFTRGDMRDLPFAGGFDAVVMFFTSFGYFETDAEHERVLAEVARVLTPGGRFLLDYVRRDEVIASLVPESSEERAGVRIDARRRITGDGRRVEKDVELTRPDGSTLTYTESVRLYEPGEVRAMMVDAGFGEIDAIDAPAPRLLLTARRAC